MERNFEEEIKAKEAELVALRQEQAAKAEEEKKARALARKEEATPVIEAIDNYEVAKADCNDKIRAAYDEYKSKVEAAEKELKLIEKDADEKLNKFLETHPEGFHYTYRSKDGNVVRNYDYRTNTYNVFDNFKIFEDAMKNFWSF